MKRSMTVLAVALLTCSCVRTKDSAFLGSAVIESTTSQVATTAQGAILSLAKEEGARVTAGEILAVIDTIPLQLKLQQARAGLAELGQMRHAKTAEIAGIEAETRGLAREYGRIGSLADKGSLPTQKKDDLGTKVQVADLRLKASRFVLASLTEKQKGIEAQIAQLEENLSRCFVRSPTDGIIISKFKGAGEILGPGMPVVEIANLDTVYADFFVPQPLLANLTYGQSVRLRLDTSEDEKERYVPATITWLSDEAEFSPRNIQTRESRNELVFKIRATAANPDGVLKRGLPVEVWLQQ